MEVDSQNQVEQAVQQKGLSTSPTRHPLVLPLVTQVGVQITLVAVVVAILAPLVVTVVPQADMVLTVGNNMQAVLEAMGLEER